jgi:endonuclease YncB( thermonuclease family)
MKIKLFRTVLSATLLAAAGAAYASEAVKAYQELFAQSQKDKRGLTFYVKGQSIPGVVTRVIGNDAVEVRNQTHGRIVIRIDSIDAIAAQ